MFKKIRLAFLILSSTLAVAAGSAAPLAFAASSAAGEISKGACEAAGQQNCTPAQAAGSLNDTIASVINLLSVLVGVAAVIMIIIGGFRYITSAGDSNKVTSAKNTIIYAIIGLIIVALAQLIVHFVLNKVK